MAAAVPAGRILMIPRGVYDDKVTYEMLDVVLHGADSWVCKKEVSGVEPTDGSECWQRLTDICAGDEIISELEKRITALEGGGGAADAVKYTEQELTDEQRAQARANIGAIEEDVLAVKELPKNFEGLYGAMGCNIFELEQGNYVDNSNSCTLYAVADDGTFKILGIASYNDVVYILRYPASIYVIQKNMTIAVSLADVSTADNIAVTYSYNKNYIETSNTREYTPTSDYHPATKKYVDDTAATAKTTAETAKTTAETALSGLVGKITAPQTAEVGQTIVVKSVDDDGAPKEWGAYTIPQADFLQNDETAADYMKNRTHWTEREKVILSETSLTQDGDEYATYLEDSIGLVAGNSYTVIYDGEEYTCIGVDLTSFMGKACVGLGNLAGLGIESAEYPFIVLDGPGELDDGICTGVMGSGEATISIVYEGETVHKLDNKYLNLDWLPITEEKGDILPETVVSINTLITGTSIYYLNIDTVISYTAGQKVVVYVNGTRYVCEILEDDGIGYIHAGALTMQCWRKYTSVVSSAPGEYTLRICELEANCLPEEYLPAGVPLIQTAEVGQVISVKAVDDEGKPTEWEVVDLPDDIGSGNSYDAIIEGLDFNFVLAQGSFEDLKTKILAGEQVYVDAYSIDGNNRWFYPVLRILYDEEDDEIEITTMSYTGSMQKFGIESDNGVYVY